MSVLKHELLEQYFAKDSRRKFLALVSRVAGAGSVGLLAEGQSGSGTSTGTSGTSAANDINILNYALSLEFLEATFWTQFLGQGALPAGVSSFSGLIGTVSGNPPAFTSASFSGASAFAGYPAAFTNGLFGLLGQIRDHEVAHAAAIISAIKSLGGTPTQPCTYTFPVTSVNDLLTTAQTIEATGVSAFDGAINLFSNPALIQTAATIATVEGRHA
ncbi:MAG: ferritin-like domain-containing protein, partial [Acidobacteriaceae bacterium]|nr:ferritin-like domain-containing protein [Acidobacteriaceae bacterium]